MSVGCIFAPRGSDSLPCGEGFPELGIPTCLVQPDDSLIKERNSRRENLHPFKILFLHFNYLSELRAAMMTARGIRLVLPFLGRGARSFATVRQANQPTIVRLSSSEIKSLKLDDRNLEKAVRHVHQDGLVVVEDVVPHEHIDFLNKKMVEDARTLQARGEDGPFNYNQGNLQQDAPPVAKYFFPSIFTSMFST